MEESNKGMIGQGQTSISNQKNSFGIQELLGLQDHHSEDVKTQQLARCEKNPKTEQPDATFLYSQIQQSNQRFYLNSGFLGAAANSFFPHGSPTLPHFMTINQDKGKPQTLQTLSIKYITVDMREKEFWGIFTASVCDQLL